MALWLVLKDFTGSVVGSAEVLAAGLLLDDAVADVPGLQAAGCPLFAWTGTPAQVNALNAFLARNPNPGSPIESENLLDLLVSFGAIGGSVVQTLQAAYNGGPAILLDGVNGPVEFTTAIGSLYGTCFVEQVLSFKGNAGETIGVLVVDSNPNGQVPLGDPGLLAIGSMGTLYIKTANPSTWATVSTGGGAVPFGFRFVVGNSIQGDVAGNCTQLDVGDGVQLQAAINAAMAVNTQSILGAGEVYIRPGLYDMTARTTFISGTAGRSIKIRGAGIDSTYIRIRPTDFQGLFSFAGGNIEISGVTIIVSNNAIAVANANTDLILLNNCNAHIHDVKFSFLDTIGGTGSITTAGQAGACNLRSCIRGIGTGDLWIHHCEFTQIPALAHFLDVAVPKDAAPIWGAQSPMRAVIANKRIDGHVQITNNIFNAGSPLFCSDICIDAIQAPSGGGNWTAVSDMSMEIAGNMLGENILIGIRISSANIKCHDNEMWVNDGTTVPAVTRVGILCDPTQSGATGTVAWDNVVIERNLIHYDLASFLASMPAISYGINIRMDGTAGVPGFISWDNIVIKDNSIRGFQNGIKSYFNAVMAAGGTPGRVTIEGNNVQQVLLGIVKTWDTIALAPTGTPRWLMNDASALFVASDAGKTLLIFGGIENNNGIFLITAFNAAAQIEYFNLFGAVEAGGTGADQAVVMPYMILTGDAGGAPMMLAAISKYDRNDFRYL